MVDGAQQATTIQGRVPGSFPFAGLRTFIGSWNQLKPHGPVYGPHNRQRISPLKPGDGSAVIPQFLKETVPPCYGPRSPLCYGAFSRSRHAALVMPKGPDSPHVQVSVLPLSGLTAT